MRIGIMAMAVAGVIGSAAPAAAQVYTSQETAREHPLFLLQGEYVGRITVGEAPVTLALQVAARGDTALEGLLYTGGLPGAGGTHEQAVKVRAEREAGFEITADPYRLVPADNGWVVTHGDGATATLRRVERRGPRLGVAPPPGGILLFDGTDTGHLANVRITEDGLLMEGAQTVEPFNDALIHVEFMLPYMPAAQGQGRANSGVYIQNRYEVQILDSFAEPPTVNGAASLYREKAASLNMSFPPLTWQSYDILFRAPRFDEAGEKTENARFTVFHNGIKVHDALELPHGTGAGKQRGEGGPGPILFQNHSDPVRFRNLWIVPGEFGDLARP